MLYTILDIETTGFNRQSDEILEVGYFQINRKLEIIRKGTLYFYKPEWKIETPAQAVHGLTREFLEKHEEEFQDNLIKLYTLFENSILIGKNSNAFDIPFIQSFMSKHAYAVSPVWVGGMLDLQDYYAPRFREWFAKQNGYATNKKGTLEELIEMTGLTQDEIKHRFLRDIDSERARAHSALYDVYMTYLLVDYAIKEFGMSI